MVEFAILDIFRGLFVVIPWFIFNNDNLHKNLLRNRYVSLGAAYVCIDFFSTRDGSSDYTLQWRDSRRSCYILRYSFDILFILGSLRVVSPVSE